MLLITAWLVSSVGHGNIAGAENSGPPTSQSASVKRFAWKVKSSSAEVTMLGSIHAGKPEMYPMPKEIESAFAAAYTLVVEVDIRNQNQASIINLIKEKGMYSDDDNLFKHIKPETQEAVASFCTTYRLPVEAAQKMRPWMFVLTATTLPLMKS